MIRREEKRIRDDAVLRPLDAIHHLRLFLNGHVLMNNADAALPCHRDSHAVFCYGIHARAHHRNVEPDFLRQVCGNINLIGHDRRIGGYQQHIIKSDRFADNLCHRILLSSL